MKNFFNLVLSFVIATSFFISCDDDTKDPIRPEILSKTDTVTVVVHDTVFYNPLYKFSLQLANPEFKEFDGVQIVISGDTSLTFTSGSDGKISTELHAGEYEISAYSRFVSSDKVFVLSGSAAYKVVKDSDFKLDLEKTIKSQIVISEVYSTNSTYRDGETDKTLMRDKYIKLYNNSSEKASVKNFCFSCAFPYVSSSSTQNHFDKYKDEGWTPATQAIWYIDEIEFEPYEEKVFVIYSPEDYTPLGGVNLKNENYYCLIDMSTEFKQPSYYTEPSEAYKKFDVIIYTKGGTTWTIGFYPALFIFSTGDESPMTFAENPDNQIKLDDKDWGKLGSSLKVKNVNIIDGVDVKNGTNATYKQRLPDVVDKGFVTATSSKNGYSFYRNVDKTATEQLPENKGKIVYGYALGTESEASGSTDPSGIDAQASIKNGAHIIYLDTDNSSNDFHQRSQATLKD